MAGAGFKTFATGEVLTASDVNTYLMQQTVMVFADSTARSTALGGNVAEGMLSYLKSTKNTEYYNGSAWVVLSTGGDITGVTAGTGLSGGGTSGDVTLSLANTAVTAGSYTSANITVDAQGRLTAAANGSSAASFSGANVTKTSATQAISNGTWTAVTFDAEDFDTANYHSTSSNTSRITVPSTGYYRFTATVTWGANTTGQRHHILKKNGSGDTVYKIAGFTQYNSDMAYSLDQLLYLTTNDYIEVWVYQDSGSSINLSNSSGRTFFTVQKEG